MLKFFLHDDQKTFQIPFDVPVVPEAAAHPEFNALAALFASHDDCLFTSDAQGRLCALSGSVASLHRVIGQAMPASAAAIQKEIISLPRDTAGASSKNGLQVNFHQKPFDTPLRYWNFILNQGSFIDYFFNRINWFVAPQHEYVTPFPLHVDLESASTCNMSCPMCYRDQMKKTGQMEVGLFKKAIDECAEQGLFSVRLSWRGETLTHPRIKEMIAYAAGRITNVSFLTNAFFLDEEMIACFIESGVSYIAVSFDGIEDTYETIRHPAKFKENYERLALLKKMRTAAQSLLPQVRLCTIWPAIRHAPERYADIMSEVSDYMVYNPYINFKGPMEIKPDFICQYPWERIVVGFDGDAQCCTGWNADDIVLGNIRDQSIYSMWHSGHMNRIRETHAAGRRMSLSSCAACRHGSKGDPNIDIRDIVERSY